MHMPKALPTTSAFPSEVSDLEREALEAAYLDLRQCYRSLMVSRGQYKGQAQRGREAISQLESRIRAIAEKEASVRTEAYEMLQIVTDVIGDLEDAGDDLVNEFGAYQLGRRSFQGGAFIGRLVKSVIRFINRWTRSKEKLEILVQKQNQIKNQLEADNGENS